MRALTPELSTQEAAGSDELCVRVGVAADRGRRLYMEDAYKVVENVPEWIERFKPDAFCPSECPSPCVFAGVFDGHGGNYTVNHIVDHIFVNFVKSGNWHDSPEVEHGITLQHYYCYYSY